jgi:cation diffusion facilitator CzcD-associated flavoprotein CzcO
MQGKRIAIIGSGHSGLCMAIRLKRAGINSFTIFEKAASLGGTWRENTYPGAACDSPGLIYCYSFEQKTDWSKKWSGQAEILAYQQHCADKYKLNAHFRFNTEIAKAQYHQKTCEWFLTTVSGEEIVVDILISAVGQLSTPSIPDITGLDDFQGPSWHTAQWNHDFDLTDKKVAMIGSAATAVQATPQLAKKVAQLHVFQRSSNWIVKQGNRRFKSWETWVLSHVPFAARICRYFIMSKSEFFLRGINKQRKWLVKFGSAEVLGRIKEEVNDESLQSALTPDFTMGAKRVLIFDDYYTSFNRDNVNLVCDGIERVKEKSILTTAGQEIDVDAIVLSTGFNTNQFLVPMEISGLNGKSLNAEWSDGAHAYKGVTVADFPNFFMMYGPNTNLGHLSIIFMIECQANYILDGIKTLNKISEKSVNLKRQVMTDYNEKIQQQLATMAWSTVDHSWYMNEDRKIVNNYPGSSPEYWWATRRFDQKNYQVV